MLDQHRGKRGTGDASVMISGAELELRSVYKSYGNVAALRDISLHVQPGEFLTLLGASGSGKTTTLNLLAGFDEPSSGRILVDGNDVTDLPPHRRNLGVVFQSYALFPHMTVSENIAFPLKMRKLSRAEIGDKVTWAISLVRLTGLEERKPGMISGGQQQRVALARALVFEPRALLMDEPLAALDRALREEIQEELKDIHSKLNTTVLYVTHDQQEAMRLSDRIAVMRNGRVEQADSPQNIYDKPANAYIANFVGKSNLVTGKLTRADGDSLQLDTGAGLVLVKARRRDEMGTHLTAAIRPESMRLLSPGQTADNNTAATVIKMAFLGPEIVLELNAWKTQVVVRSSAKGQLPHPVPGDTVRIGWDAEDFAGVYPAN
jgi:putative spermidine/putrescine transport system ATP-binding protein